METVKKIIAKIKLQLPLTTKEQALFILYKHTIFRGVDNVRL